MIIIKKLLYYGHDASNRKVGLADWRVRNEGAITIIRITERTKDGRLMYPNDMYMATSEIAKYPIDEYTVPGQKLYIVPIKDLKIVDPVFQHGIALKPQEQDTGIPKVNQITEQGKLL